MLTARRPDDGNAPGRWAAVPPSRELRGVSSRSRARQVRPGPCWLDRQQMSERGGFDETALVPDIKKKALRRVFLMTPTARFIMFDN